MTAQPSQETVKPEPTQEDIKLQRRLDNEELGGGERLHKANRELTALRNAVEVQKHDERALRSQLDGMTKAAQSLRASVEGVVGAYYYGAAPFKIDDAMLMLIPATASFDSNVRALTTQPQPAAGMEGKNELSTEIVLLRELVDHVEPTVPSANCSCHISPPCNDCVDWSGIREVLANANEVLKKAKA